MRQEREKCDAGLSLLLTAVVVAGLLVSATQAAAGSSDSAATTGVTLVKQVKQYDTTWTFDQPVRAGQFVNGDWWIVPNAGQTAVTVVSVDPAPVKTTSGKLINGSMVNPKPGLLQALDERALMWKGEQTATYPVKLMANQSLLSAVSFSEDESRTVPTTSLLPRIHYAAVLTCLPQPAAPTDFRPSFTGSIKTIYSSLKLHRELLPELPVVGTPPDIKLLAAARFSRPWIEFPLDWGSCSVRSEWESGYGREKAVDVGGAALVLCLDHKVVGDKEPLIIGLTQMGIDLYGTLCAGGRWPTNGGHLMGRKLPILFAGLMLGDKDMLGIGKKYAPATNTFQEDVMAFIVTKEDVERKLTIMCHGKVKEAGPDMIGLAGSGPDGVPRFGRLMGNKIKITEGPGAGQVRTITKDDVKWAVAPPAVVKCTVTPKWDVVPVAEQSVFQVLGFQQEDIGHAKWGGTHALTPQFDNPSNYMEYCQVNKVAWPGEVLAARILGLKEAWNQPAVFQLMDEYIAESSPGGPLANVRPRFWSTGNKYHLYSVSGDFIAKMWETYRAKY